MKKKCNSNANFNLNWNCILNMYLFDHTRFYFSLHVSYFWSDFSLFCHPLPFLKICLKCVPRQHAGKPCFCVSQIVSENGDSEKFDQNFSLLFLTNFVLAPGNVCAVQQRVCSAAEGVQYSRGCAVQRGLCSTVEDIQWCSGGISTVPVRWRDIIRTVEDIQ